MKCEKCGHELTSKELKHQTDGVLEYVNNFGYHCPPGHIEVLSPDVVKLKVGSAINMLAQKVNEAVLEDNDAWKLLRLLDARLTALEPANKKRGE